MKKGTKVEFRFAGSAVEGIVEGVSDKTGKTLVRGTDDGYLYPISEENLIKTK
jgi:hypothetical protein